VVTYDGQPTLKTYFGKDKNTRPDGPMPTNYGKLISTNTDNGITTVVMSRPLAVVAGTEQYNVAINDGPTILLAAIGGNSSFGYHGNRDRGAVFVNFWDPSVIFPEHIDRANVVVGSYKANDNFRVNWWLDTNGPQIINFQLVAKTTGWFGLGLNAASTSSMQSAAITSCTVDSVTGEVKVSNYYANTATGKPSVGPVTPSFSTAVSGHYNSIDQTSSVTFSKSLNSGGQYDSAISNGNVNIIWAYSEDNSKNFGYHGKNRGGFVANLLGGGGGSDVAGTVLLYIHGISMTLAWAVCTSLGIFIARYTKNNMPVWWMYWHIIVFVLTIVLTILGFICALGLKGWKLTFENPHTVIGFIIFLGTFLQPILGIIADRMFVPTRTGPPIFPDQIHWYVGRLLWLTGLLNIYLGLELVGAHFLLKVAFYFWVAYLIAIFVFRPKPDDSKHALPVDDSTDEEREKLINNTSE
jgi:hypothetical protein